MLCFGRYQVYEGALGEASMMRLVPLWGKMGELVCSLSIMENTNKTSLSFNLKNNAH